MDRRLHGGACLQSTPSSVEMGDGALCIPAFQKVSQKGFFQVGKASGCSLCRWAAGSWSAGSLGTLAIQMARWRLSRGHHQASPKLPYESYPCVFSQELMLCHHLRCFLTPGLVIQVRLSVILPESLYSYYRNQLPRENGNFAIGLTGILSYWVPPVPRRGTSQGPVSKSPRFSQCEVGSSTNRS